MLDPCYNCQKSNKYFFNCTLHRYVSYKCHTNIGVWYLCLTRTRYLRKVFEIHRLYTTSRTVKLTFSRKQRQTFHFRIHENPFDVYKQAKTSIVLSFTKLALHFPITQRTINFGQISCVLLKILIKTYYLST